MEGSDFYVKEVMTLNLVSHERAFSVEVRISCSDLDDPINALCCAN